MNSFTICKDFIKKKLFGHRQELKTAYNKYLLRSKLKGVECDCRHCGNGHRWPYKGCVLNQKPFKYKGLKWCDSWKEIVPGTSNYYGAAGVSGISGYSGTSGAGHSVTASGVHASQAGHQVSGWPGPTGISGFSGFSGWTGRSTP